MILIRPTLDVDFSTIFALSIGFILSASLSLKMVINMEGSVMTSILSVVAGAVFLGRLKTTFTCDSKRLH